MISIRDALEIVVIDAWNAGQDKFIDALLVFLQMSQSQQLATIKAQLGKKVTEKKAQRDSIQPNADAAIVAVQAEIDELQAFIDA